MKPVDCIVAASDAEHGDCWRACIASILELPARDVPNFVDLHLGDIDGRYRHLRGFLKQRGLAVYTSTVSGEWPVDAMLQAFSGRNPDVPMIIGGAAREGGNHAVIAMNGKIVHDPSGSGLIGPCACHCDDESCDGNDCDDPAAYWIDIICADGGRR